MTGSGPEIELREEAASRELVDAEEGTRPDLPRSAIVPDEPSDVATDPDSGFAHPWAVVARSVAMSALLGAAVVMWGQFSFRARWVSEFLSSNKLGADQRMALIVSLCAGLGVGALAGAAALLFFKKKLGRGPAALERWLWFLLPLSLLPLMPLLFRFKPWQNKHDRLLPIVLFVVLVLEVLVFRALRNVPSRVRRWWAETRDQLPLAVRRDGPFVVVVAGTLVYIAFFTFFLLRWHYKLRTGNFDLSINNNLMFGGLYGDFLKSTVAFPDNPAKYLATHAKFGTYLFLPIYALVPRPETLLVIQAVVIGAGALPLYAFARQRLSDWAAAAIALCYLGYYPMHGASFSEFQNVPIAATFVLATVWAAEVRRWRWFSAFFVVALLMREDIPVGLAVIGGVLLLSGHRPVAGAIMAGVSVIYFAVLRFYVMEEAGDWWFPNMYKELFADGEKGFKSVVKTLLTNPLFVLSKLVVEKKLIYLMHLLVPLAFLPARRWYLWAAFIPGALLTLLVTSYDPPITFSFHYVMHWAPYLFLGAVLALDSIGKGLDFGPERRRAALAAMVSASLVLSYNYGAFARRANSFKGGFHKVEFTFTDAERQRYENLMELIKVIPKDASVAATEKVGPHLSSRRVMHTMRTGPHGAEWIVASSRELKLSRTRPSLKAVLEKNEYGVVRRIGDLALFKKGHDVSGNAALIRDWKL